MTFKASVLSGESYNIQGTATDNTDVLAVTASAATEGQTIDLSGLKMDSSLTKAMQDTTITGSGYADTITGTNVADSLPRVLVVTPSSLPPQQRLMVLTPSQTLPKVPVGMYSTSLPSCPVELSR
ncbi:hypothetical protein [Vreelandella lionensis]|uniref:hypothetical protein n=1 Tax=Vreelandella lionensis TaxID=1144478 RepID=UPI0009F1C6A8|nr:hypothetical protein [Halomonas lionensis]